MAHTFQHIIADNTTPIEPLDDDSESPLLQKLMLPLNFDEFLTNTYTKGTVAITNMPSHRFKAFTDQLFFGLNIQELIQNSASDQISVWIKNQSTQKIESFKTEPNIAWICYQSQRAAIYCRSSMEAQDNIISRCISELGMGATGFYEDGLTRGEVEIFIAPEGHFTDWHYDFQQNFTLQLKGRKEWFFKSGLVNPIKGFTPHYHNSGNLEAQIATANMSGGDVEFDGETGVHSVVLGPGDALYHPAGVFHSVRCLEESISVNISLMGVTYIDLILSTLRNRLMGYQELRQYMREDANSELDRFIEIAQQEMVKVSKEQVVPQVIISDNYAYYNLGDEPPQIQVPKRMLLNGNAVLIDVKMLPEPELAKYLKNFEGLDVEFLVHVYPCIEEGQYSLLRIGVKAAGSKQRNALKMISRLKRGSTVPLKANIKGLGEWLVFLGIAVGSQLISSVLVDFDLLGV